MGLSLPPIRWLAGTARKAASVGANLVDEAWRKVADRPGVWTNPAAPKAPAKFPLRLVSYNVLKGPQNHAAVVAELRQLQPDVACLQEVYGKERALALAKDLGMHVAFFPNNKAVLSRYPIRAAQDVPYDVPLAGRLADAWRSGSGEPLEARSAGIATLRVGGRTLDVVDTHLSLSSARANAADLRQLDALVQARRAQGRSVLVAGDFNHNLALARGGVADARGQALTPTDTFAEFQDRYGARPAGNVQDPAARAAARDLLAGLEASWGDEARTMRVGGRTWTPEAALAELQSGRVARGSAAWKRLWQVVDGVTHPGAGKRFDNVLATPELRFTSSFVDADARASDHRPLVVDVAFP